MSAPDEPKLIIDTDWKAQAQAEKERLAAKQAPKPGPGSAPVPGPGKPPAHPAATQPAASAAHSGSPTSAAGGPSGAAASRQPADAEHAAHGSDRIRFGDLVSMLASQALLYMGAYPDPKTGQAMVSLEYAKLHIDLLAVLQEKTKGNLDDAERTMLERVTHELRMEFVELAREIDKAVREGRIQRGGSAGGAIGGGPAGGIVTAGPASIPDFPPITPR